MQGCSCRSDEGSGIVDPLGHLMGLDRKDRQLDSVEERQGEGVLLSRILERGDLDAQESKTEQ